MPWRDLLTTIFFLVQIWEMAALSAFLLIREVGAIMAQRGEVSCDQTTNERPLL